MDLADVAVIGGGVVGTAVFRELVLQGYNVILLEKNANVVHGASCGNSGIACTGYDAPIGSLERRCIRRAMELNPTVYRELGLPSAAVGSLVIAWTPADLDGLPHIVAANHAIGDTQVRTLSPDELYAMEPHLAKGALGGVFVPGEVVIEPWLIPIAYLHHSLRNGGTLRTNHNVVGGSFDKGVWTLQCATDAAASSVPVRARVVVNCAGLYGDIVEQIRTPNVGFHIRPRKGQYIVLDAPPHAVTRVLQPVPTDRTKGVFVFRNLYGHVVVGPTADDQDARDDFATTPETLAMLRAAAAKVVPALAACGVVGSYAGLRPATEHRDYQIGVDAARQWVTVGGIRSTGVTASLGIADYVTSLIRESFPEVAVAGRGKSLEYTLPAVHELATQLNKTSVALDGYTHHVTHPLSLWGLRTLATAQDASRL